MRHNLKRRLSFIFALALCLAPVQAAQAATSAPNTHVEPNAHAEATPPATTNAPANTTNTTATTTAIIAETTTATPAPTNTSIHTTNAPDERDQRLTFMEETEREAGTAAGATAPGAAGLLARTLGALLIIVGLIAAAGWGVRKFGGGRFGATATDAPALSVVSSVALGDKRSLALVRFGGRTLLVGSTTQAVTLLAEDKLREEDSRVDADAMPTPRSVADLLRDDNLNGDALTNDALVLHAHDGEQTGPFELQLAESRRRLADTYAAGANAWMEQS